MSLICLPTELIEHITSSLDLLSLSALRLTCCSLSEQTLQIFTSRYFTTRTISWSKHGLDDLVIVIKHPFFGPAIKELRIDSTPIHAHAIYNFRWEMSKSAYLASITGAHGTAGEAYEGAQAQQDRLLELERTADGEKKWWAETRYDVKILIRIFTSMAQRGTVLDRLLFMCKGVSRRRVLSVAEFCQGGVQSEGSRPFVSTMTALATSGLNVQRISIDPADDYGAVSIGRFETLAPHLRSLFPMLQHLHTLNLNLRDWRPANPGFEDGETYKPPFLIRFLSLAENLTTLSLSCYSALDPTLSAHLARTCKFPHLQSCTLSFLTIQDPAHLPTFLHPSRTTLTYLSLANLALAHTNTMPTWPSLLAALFSNATTLLVLETVSLQNLFVGDEARAYFGRGVRWSRAHCGDAERGLEAVAEFKKGVGEGLGKAREEYVKGVQGELAGMYSWRGRWWRGGGRLESEVEYR